MKILKRILSNENFIFGFLLAFLLKSIQFLGFIYFNNMESGAIYISIPAKIFFLIGSLDYAIFAYTLFIGGPIGFFAFLISDNKVKKPPSVDRKIVYTLVSYIALNAITVGFIMREVASELPLF